jgi:hypothetical protein
MVGGCNNICYLANCSYCMQTKLSKIKRTDCLVAYPNFPQADYKKEVFFYPKAVSSYTLVLYSKSARGHAKNLSVEFSKLIEAMGMDRLIFLGDSKRAWRYQDNPYLPVQQALAYLEDKGVGKRFDGGLAVDINQLPVFLTHFFWLVRCNAALPYFHFMDPGQHFVGHICQYGNVYISILASALDPLFREAVGKTQFVDVGDERVYSTFSHTTRIPSRRTVVK